jgi:protein tyrosine/serine phosphatase
MSARLGREFLRCYGRTFKEGLKMRDGLKGGVARAVRVKLFAASLALLLSPLCARSRVAAQSGDTATQTQKVEQTYAELPNFHAVNARLYRGGQPHAGGLQRLAALGVKTVVNLRDDDARAREEGEEARALGLRYFNVPLSRAHRPDARQMSELFALLDAPENQPVFIHCKRGADRTGALVAVYRVSHDGWTAGRAVEEAERYGMGFWQRGKKDFIRDYYRDHPRK